MSGFHPEDRSSILLCRSNRCISKTFVKMVKFTNKPLAFFKKTIYNLKQYIFGVLSRWQKEKLLRGNQRIHLFLIFLRVQNGMVNSLAGQKMPLFNTFVWKRNLLIIKSMC